MKLLLLLSFLFLTQPGFTLEIPVMDGYGPGAINVSVIKYEVALKLFNEFKARRDLSFGFPIDGCYARATIMTRLAEEQGIKFARMNAYGDLRVDTKTKEFKVVEWGWHVAPMVYVMKDGKSIPMVIDPSLFDRPVTIAEWLEKMKYSGDGKKAYVDGTYVGSPYQYLSRAKEQQRTSWNKIDVDDATEAMRYYLPYDPTRTTVMSVRKWDSNSPKRSPPKPSARELINGIAPKPLPLPGGTAQ